jgi:hypothetical protein
MAYNLDLFYILTIHFIDIHNSTQIIRGMALLNIRNFNQRLTYSTDMKAGESNE